MKVRYIDNVVVVEIETRDCVAGQTPASTAANLYRQLTAQLANPIVKMALKGTIKL